MNSVARGIESRSQGELSKVALLLAKLRTDLSSRALLLVPPCPALYTT